MPLKTKKVTKIDELKARINEIEDDVIRKKAYYIHLRDHCNDSMRNWLKAKEELQTV